MLLMWDKMKITAISRHFTLTLTLSLTFKRGYTNLEGQVIAPKKGIIIGVLGQAPNVISAKPNLNWRVYKQCTNSYKSFGHILIGTLVLLLGSNSYPLPLLFRIKKENNRRGN